VNKNHAALCPSPQWAAVIQTELLPSLVADVQLGEQMLEVGPGPGAATEWLRHKVRHLTALELDQQAAEELAAKYAGTNVEVVIGDAAAAMIFADASFDSVGTFTMLHHVPTTALQDRLLAEVLRVLRPGGVLIGSDSLASNELHHFHEADTYNPIEPASLLPRLQTLGFRKITIVVDGMLKFTAHKPPPTPAAEQDSPGDLGSAHQLQEEALAS
jgi:SAM-dependent methyltransferase